MCDFKYYDTDKRGSSDDINLLFPEWQGKGERLAVFSPHDDDAIIGAGYAMAAAKKNGAEVFVYIMCKGNGGYSDPKLKYTIAGIREKETDDAYNAIGIDNDHIVRFGFSDFGAVLNFGWDGTDTDDRAVKKIITALRKNHITRIMIPNHNREHADHTCVHLMASYDAAQAGDPIVVDWAEPTNIKTVLEYAVWADFSAENALECGRNINLKANKIIKASADIEKEIDDGILLYKSQGKIIYNLIESRKERLTSDGCYIELYIEFDPRPRLDFSVYKKFVDTF